MICSGIWSSKLISHNPIVIVHLAAYTITEKEKYGYEIYSHYKILVLTIIFLQEELNA